MTKINTTLIENKSREEDKLIGERKVVFKNIKPNGKIPHKKNLSSQLNVDLKQTLNRKELYNKNITSVIPLKIYQAWHSDDIPISIKECIKNIKDNNPEFEHHLFNIDNCRKFIQDNFPENILNAYDLIIPYAIKIDLWRYCILYLYGGIYLDIKYYCINNFKFIYLTSDEFFCKDLQLSGNGIYNALIICKPQNDIILKCINKVVENVSNKFYGKYALEPTGPLMMKNFFSENQVNNLKLELKNQKSGFCITYRNNSILQFHKDYRKEQNSHKSNDQKHWAHYWMNRTMYLDKLPIELDTPINNNEDEIYSSHQNISSTIEEQKIYYVPFIKSLIKDNNITSIVDLGCGDFTYGILIYHDLNVKYYGYDIYKKYIDFHKTTKLRDKYCFTHLNFLKSKNEIINGDLCIIKDVLTCWSLNNIYDFLDYITQEKKFKFILICNDSLQNEDTTDIKDGDFRPLSSNFYPLKKYNPKTIFTYLDKEISLITL